MHGSKRCLTGGEQFISASLFFKYFISDPCVDNQNQFDSKVLMTMVFRMKEKIEREHDLQLRREELRLIRQQEAEDRKWRKQEMEVAQAKAIKDAEIKMILDEQIR